MTTISVVIETDSIHEYDDITIADCIRAITRQTYPADQFEVIAVGARCGSGATRARGRCRG
jgi:hypothetical protein